MQAAVSSSCAAHGLHFPFPAFAKRAARSGMALPSSSAAAASSSSSFPSRSRLLSPSRAFSTSAATDGSGKGDEASVKPWLLVGLGNPGKMYQGTRHNVGFEMLDAIAEAEGISMSSVRFKAMFGKVPKGGHGGHNGMRSVIHHLKGNSFPRLRIGIGRPPGKMDPASFVLRPFNKKEREELDFSFVRGVEAVRILVAEGLNKSATFVNSAPSQLLNN